MLIKASGLKSLSKTIAPTAQISQDIFPSLQLSLKGIYPGVPLIVPLVKAELRNTLLKSMSLTSKGSIFKTMLSGFKSL